MNKTEYLQKLNADLEKEIKAKDKIITKSMDKEENEIRFNRLEAVSCLVDVRNLMSENLTDDNRYKAERLEKQLKFIIDRFNALLEEKKKKGVSKSVIYYTGEKGEDYQPAEETDIIVEGDTITKDLDYIY